VVAEPTRLGGSTRCPSPEQSRAAWVRRLGLAFALALLCSPIVLPLVPGTDQVLFLDHSAAMLRGATLYVDVWDNKPPGVFALYALMQAAFGPGWPGVVIGYALWMAAAAALLASVAWIARPDGRAWLLTVALSVGLLYLRSNADQVAQVEEWVLLPLSAILLLATMADRPGAPSAPRWIAVGVCTALVATLKVVLLPVAAAIIAATLLARIARDGLAWRHAWAAIALSVAGFAFACAPVAAWFVQAGAWPEFWWTTFVYPGLAVVGTEAAPVSRLLDSLGWLAKSAFALVPAVALALIGAWRAPSSTLACAVSGTLAWVASGLAMIVAQKFSWWSYHMPLVLWPIGLLAALGCAAAADAASPRPAVTRLQRLAIAACMAGLALHAAHLARKWTSWPDWPYLPGQREAIAIARQVAANATPACGTSVSIGDQSGVQSATGLRKALPTQAVFWGAYLPSQIRRLPGELAAARPDLVYVDGSQRDEFDRRFPEVGAAIQGWLERDYTRRATDPFDGQWWERTPSAAAGPCPAPARFVIPPR
jgi:hypothetical protein